MQSPRFPARQQVASSCFNAVMWKSPAKMWWCWAGAVEAEQLNKVWFQIEWTMGFVLLILYVFVDSVMLALPKNWLSSFAEFLRSTLSTLGGQHRTSCRSNIVGMPVSQILQSMDATVTVCHSRTKDMLSYLRNADIVICLRFSGEMGSKLVCHCIVSRSLMCL